MSLVRMLSMTSGLPVELIVKRVLKLRDPPGSRSTSATEPGQEVHPHASATQDEDYADGDEVLSREEMMDLVQIRADLEGQREDIDRIDTTGFKIISKLADSVSRIETDLQGLGKEINDCRNDLRGNQDDLTSLKTEMKHINGDVDVKVSNATAAAKVEAKNAATQVSKQLRLDSDKFASEVRRELVGVQAELRKTRGELEDLRATFSGNTRAREEAAEMMALRKQLAEMRKDMDQMRKAMTDRKEPQVPAFPSRELDILTSSITKIGNRASQVETLQMELEILKGRVERVEGSVLESEKETRSVPRSSSAYQPDTESRDSARSFGRKRSLLSLRRAGRREELDDAVPSKRFAFSSETDGAAGSSPIVEEAIILAGGSDDDLQSHAGRPTQSTGGRKKPQRRVARKSGPF
jgi:predicted  nucleic acid-binding Zn-ribbon protein